MWRRALLAIAMAPAVWAQDSALALLAERCAKCHSGSAALSGFDLSTRTGLLKGGKHGSAVTPGDPASSRLFQWVSEGKMPPDARLTEPQIQSIRAWIESGAAWTGPEKLQVEAKRAGRDWWALQTPQRPEVPAAASNPVDFFVLSKLRAHGLEQAPVADHRTLIRRLSFDLMGLPPTPEQMSEPYEKAVERLLASPHYGERWGRYWLDVVRFGETDGGEHNFERFSAWRYRDYVIDAFNRDKPYNQFIREQLAGDAIYPDNPGLVAATGFLVAGPWDSVSAELNKDLAMKAAARQDELDDMLTTTFASFQGLTLNCARCHDHKFDPIPTRDYYRIAALFNGSGFGKREVATGAERTARETAAAPVRAELNEVRARLDEIEGAVRSRLLIEKYSAFDAARAKEAKRIPVNPLWNRNAFAPVTAKRFRMVVVSSGKDAPLVRRLDLLPGGTVARDWRGAEAASADRPAILTLNFAEPRTVSEIRWASEAAIKVYRFEWSVDGERWTTLCSSLDHVAGSELDLPDLPEAELLSALSPPLREERKRLLSARVAAQARYDAIPALTAIHAVNPHSTTPAYVLDRGNVQKRGEEVAPGALSAIGQISCDLPSTATDSERRLALADWIASPNNPLTARVIVNRIWYYHFGTGIVNTPSDFGFNGDRPSHPELLDYLANAFVEHGWSVKWLHRLILTSRTYRQSATFNEKAHSIDAGNRLLWRMPLKRMDAETLRDSILFAAGSLNQKTGGPGFLLQKKGDRGSYIYSAVDNDGPEVWRRAVYRFVVRGGDRIMLDSFDCPDPSVATPQRSLSNTPVQALTLMNNAFVLRQAGILAARIGSDPDPIRRASHILFQREPSAAEIATGLRFLKDQPLAAYLRALLNSNEFVYVP